MGCEISIAYVDNRPWTYEANSTGNCEIFLNGSNKIICGFYHGSITYIKQLLHDANLTAKFIHVEDNEYGVKHEETGKWTGIVGSLAENKADIGLAFLTLTQSRRQAIDFTTYIRH